MSTRIEDLNTSGNHTAVACRAGVVKLFKYETSEYTSLKSFHALGVTCATLCNKAEQICLNGVGMGTRIIDVSTDQVLFSDNHDNIVKSQFYNGNQGFMKAKSSNLFLYDMRTPELGNKIFDCQTENSRLNNHYVRNDISSFVMDDVKVIVGKSDGTILLWDIRKNSECIRKWGIPNPYSSKHGYQRIYPRLKIESLDFSPNKIFAISRYSLFHINIL